MEFQHVESFAVGRFIVGESNGNTALKSEKEGIRGCVDGKGSFESNCRSDHERNQIGEPSPHGPYFNAFHVIIVG